MMKRMFVVLAMVPMFAQAADLSAGTIQIRGDSNLGFLMGSSKEKGATESNDTTAYGLGVTGLYAVINNLGVGLALDYANENTEFGASKNELGSSSFAIGPAVSYDYPLNEKANVFALAAVQYVSETQTSATAGVSNPDVGASGFGFDVGVGAKYFLAKSFSLDGMVGYGWNKLTDDKADPVTDEKGEVTNSGFGFNVGLSVYFDMAGK